MFKQEIINGCRIFIAAHPVGGSGWTWTANIDNIILVENKGVLLSSAELALAAARETVAVHVTPQ